MGSILSGVYDIETQCKCSDCIPQRYTPAEKRRHKIRVLKFDLKRAKQDVKYIEKEIKKLQKTK